MISIEKKSICAILAFFADHAAERSENDRYFWRENEGIRKKRKRKKPNKKQIQKQKEGRERYTTWVTR